MRGELISLPPSGERGVALEDVTKPALPSWGRVDLCGETTSGEQRIHQIRDGLEDHFYFFFYCQLSRKH